VKNIDGREDTFTSEQFKTRDHSLVHADSIDSTINMLDTVIDKNDLELPREISSPALQQVRNVYLTQENTEDSDYL